MKTFLILFLFAIAPPVFSQCSDCQLLSEALKEPKSVIKLKHNSYQTGVTLDSLPASIGKMENIEILYLSDHEIKSIPPEIGQLKKLKGLSFAGCKLESLPEEIFLLTNLKELVLLDNQFSEEYKKELKKKLAEKLPDTKVFL